MRPWFPNYEERSPHSRIDGQAVLSGVVPFDPFPGNYGRLARATFARSGSTGLAFSRALRPLPLHQDCFTESLQTVYVLFRGEGTVEAPEGWAVEEVNAQPGWPGTTYLLHSPSDFEGLSVTLDISGRVLRILSLNEWRGETCGDDEPGDPGGPGDPQ